MPSKISKKPAKKEKATGRGAPAKAGAKKPTTKPMAKSSAKVAPKKAPVVSKSVVVKGKGSAPVAKPSEKVNGKVREATPTKSVAPAKVSATAPSKPEAKEGAGSSPKGSTMGGGAKKPKVKSKIQMPVDPLFKPGAKWKPLIPSGPNATPTGLVGHHSNSHGVKPVIKTTLNKRELEGYRKILMQKRAELVGDIRHMEDEALRQSGSGSLSQTPQHMADQGSDTFEQSLSLDLAAVDRSLIREIDDALKRIDDGTYGMCERTGKPINAMRLNELPWARYSIEAARELERRPYQE